MVRSNRGRAAALRPIWSWPLRSPARFALCTVAVVVLLIISGKLTNHGGSGSSIKPGITQPCSTPAMVGDTSSTCSTSPASTDLPSSP